MTKTASKRSPSTYKEIIIDELIPEGGILSSEFQVLTETGWKEFQELTIGENIFSVDITTGKSVLNPITELTCKEYSGDAYEIDGRNIKAKILPKHKLLMVNRSNKYEYNDIEDIHSRQSRFNHHSVPKLMDFDGNTNDKFIIPGLDFDTYNDNTKFTNNQANDLVFDTMVFAKFIGFWLAEGSNSTDGYTISMAQSLGANPEVCTIIDELMSQMPKELNIHRREYDRTKPGDTYKKNIVAIWSFHDKRVSTYLCNMGNVYTKSINTDIKNLSAEYLKELVYFFGLGDGRKTKIEGTDKFKIRNMASVSKKLIDDLQECNLKAGGSGNNQILDDTKKEGGYLFEGRTILYKNKQILYQTELSTTKLLSLDARMIKINKFEYTGEICNVVSKHKNFMIRYDNKSFWVGT